MNMEKTLRGGQKSAVSIALARCRCNPWEAKRWRPRGFSRGVLPHNPAQAPKAWWFLWAPVPPCVLGESAKGAPALADGEVKIYAKGGASVHLKANGDVLVKPGSGGQS